MMAKMDETNEWFTLVLLPLALLIVMVVGVYVWWNADDLSKIPQRPAAITWGSWERVEVPDPRVTPETQEVQRITSQDPQGITCTVYANRTSKEMPWRMSFTVFDPRVSGVDLEVAMQSCKNYAARKPAILR